MSIYKAHNVSRNESVAPTCLECKSSFILNVMRNSKHLTPPWSSLMSRGAYRCMFTFLSQCRSVLRAPLHTGRWNVLDKLYNGLHGQTEFKLPGVMSGSYYLGCCCCCCYGMHEVASHHPCPHVLLPAASGCSNYFPSNWIWVVLAYRPPPWWGTTTRWVGLWPRGVVHGGDNERVIGCGKEPAERRQAMVLICLVISRRPRACRSSYVRFI